MTIRIYNTQTRTTEPLETIEPGVVRMYVCGVTPYAKAHIGHAMSSIVFDVIKRYLTYRGYTVRHVTNFTDIDDKIIARANREGIGADALTENLINEWHAEIGALNVLPADAYPRATQEVDRIIEMIEGLIRLGHAYQVDGDVYFRVRSFEGYGKLSHRSLDDLLSGARIEVDERKDDPLDFALWKATKPGEPWWESPWGKGRPGWHIECSAMCSHHLGGLVDIHGGGADLIFPHHENEIAQSEAYLEKEPFSRYWVHNGLLQLGGEKMSKSIGNLVTHRGIDRPETNRSVSGTGAAVTLSGATDLHRRRAGGGPPRTGPNSRCTVRQAAVASSNRFRLSPASQKKRWPSSKPPWTRISTHPGRLQRSSILPAQSTDRPVMRHRAEVLRSARAMLCTLLGVLGIDLEADVDSGDLVAAPFVDLLLRIRDQLRAAKHWDEADAIRTGLSELGVSIADGPEGATWRKET